MVNYQNIKIPDDKPRSEYTYNERRATIFKLLIEKGDPAKLPTYESLGNEFDVSANQIKKDLNDHIKPYIRKNLSQDVKVRMKTFLDKAVQERIDSDDPDPEDWERAFELMKEYSEWLFEEGSMEKEPEKREVDMNGELSIDSVMSQVEENLEKAEELEDE